MIFNERSFIRLLKRELKTGLIYGYLEENYVFGGANWRAAIHQDKVTQGILGELMKMTALYPKNGAVFTVNKEKMAQYTITHPREFKEPDDGHELGVTDIIINDYLRVTAGSELRLIFEDFIQVLDQDSVTDEEYRYEGPFYSESEDNFFWKNDTCILKVSNEYRGVYNETLDLLRKMNVAFPINERYTFH